MMMSRRRKSRRSERRRKTSFFTHHCLNTKIFLTILITTTIIITITIIIVVAIAGFKLNTECITITIFLSLGLRVAIIAIMYNQIQAHYCNRGTPAHQLRLAGARKLLLIIYLTLTSRESIDSKLCQELLHQNH